MSVDADIVSAFISSEHLPASYRRQAEQWFLPLLPALLEQVHQGELRVLGIVGSQGSGKSTLAGLLHALLTQHYHLRVVNLSLDDFYLSRAERQRLAATVHPLLASRGVPGTHDVELAIDTLRNLRDASGPTALPRFDKAQDDCLPRARWQRVEAPVDLIILEGWCLALPPQNEAEIATPINALEREQDCDKTWRQFVNRCLRDEYAQLFEMIDYLIYLRAPNFAAVHRWRQLQEDKLQARLMREGQLGDNKVMNEEQLAAFMQHFERLTRHGFDRLGDIADVEFVLDEQQGINSCYKRARAKNGAPPHASDPGRDAKKGASHTPLQRPPSRA